jgi:hypothetical protein
MPMARLAGVPSGLRSAAGFRRKPSYRRGLRPTRMDPECWRDAAYSIRHTPRRYSLPLVSANGKVSCVTCCAEHCKAQDEVFKTFEKQIRPIRS